MANYKFIGLVASILFLSAFTLSGPMSWNISENHSIKFSTKKADGDFKDFTGDIQFDKDNLQNSKFDVQVDVNSIRTGNFLKNKHAKGKNWFNSKEYPTIKFTSKSFAATATGYEVTGTLDLRGIQKDITIPFTFSNNTFKGNFTVDRSEFKVGKTTGMSKSVGNEIKIDLIVPVSK